MTGASVRCAATYAGSSLGKRGGRNRITSETLGQTGAINADPHDFDGAGSSRWPQADATMQGFTSSAFPATSSSPGDSTSFGRYGPEIQFEDLPSHGTQGPTGDGAGDEIPWSDELEAELAQELRASQGMSDQGSSMASVPRRLEKKPPPLTDEGLVNADLSRLQRDEVIWAAGRAATLGISDVSFWTNVASAVAAMGEADLSPSEVCRLVQAFAYAPVEAPLEDAQLRRLFKAFSNRAPDYNDERISRLAYGYGKLAAKRGLSMPRFFDFVTSEVVERGRTMKGWRKVRILQALGHLPAASEEFRTILVGQIMNDLRSLDAMCLASFAPMLPKLGFHTRPGVLEQLNAAFKKKLKHTNFGDPDLILRSGLPLLLYDLMKTSVLIKWLERLDHLRLPLSVGSIPRLPKSKVEATEAFGTETSDAQDNDDEGLFLGWDKPPNMPDLEDVRSLRAREAREARALATATPADARRVALNLEALKLAELCLRHERPEAMQVLPPRCLRLLAAARNTPLEPPEDHQLPELPFVLAELGRLLRLRGLLLHPTIYGPYLLELADPLGRVVVEWDANWALYPPWRQAQHSDYVRRKHLHLKAEGWKVLCVPLAEFQTKQGKEGKLEFLGSFIRLHRLDHLSVGQKPHRTH